VTLRFIHYRKPYIIHAYCPNKPAVHGWVPVDCSFDRGPGPLETVSKLILPQNGKQSPIYL